MINPNQPAIIFGKHYTLTDAEIIELKLQFGVDVIIKQSDVIQEGKVVMLHLPAIPYRCSDSEQYPHGKVDIIALFNQWFSYTAMQHAAAMDDMTNKINSDDNPEYRITHITDADFVCRVRSDKRTQKEFEAQE